MGIREQLESMSAREQKLLGALAVLMLGMLVVGVPVYIWSSLWSARDRNGEIRALLVRMEQASDLLAKRKSERQAHEELYRKPAPALASFIESAAKTNGLDVPESTDQPEAKGKGFTERSTVVKMRKVGLKPLVQMLEKIETSGHPVAITQLNISAKAGGPDTYDVKLGVSAYDKKAAAPKDKGKAKAPAPFDGSGPKGPEPKEPAAGAVEGSGSEGREPGEAGEESP